MKQSITILSRSLCLALGVLARPAVAQQCQVLFAEDFDSIELGENVMEGIETGSGGQMDDVWTPDLPPGWSDTFSCVGDGVTEWQGWNIAKGSWWQSTTGDQGRSSFTVNAGHYSFGACIIADGDEWDDFNRQGCGPFNAFVTTPIIDLTGVTAGSVALSFVESWRDQPDQEASLEVSFDRGSTWTTVLHYSSVVGDSDYQEDILNGSRSIAIDNPADATSIRLRFGYYNAGNDKWWALDDIVVIGELIGEPIYPPGKFEISVPAYNPEPGAVISWGDACGAEDYVVELAKDSGFADVWQSADTGATSYIIPADMPPGVYYARVLARNLIGQRRCFEVARIAIGNPCAADTNGDGVVNTLDFLEYLNRWMRGCE